MPHYTFDSMKPAWMFGGATRSRTGLIGFAIQYAMPVQCSASSKINDLAHSGITPELTISYIRADFYQRPKRLVFDWRM
jgi:hypothetical protein